MPTKRQHDSTVPTATAPIADPARNAIHAIRGYEYQTLAAALAWLSLDEQGLLFLEVAEDYAEVVGSAINAVQVKDTRASGPITLNTGDVRDAIASFVHLAEENPNRSVQLRYLTTSTIGMEKATRGRLGGHAGLDYWQRVRLAQGDVGPLRQILEHAPYPDAVRRFCKKRSDLELCEDLIRRVTWECGRPDATNLRKELEQRLALVLSDQFRIPSQEAPRVADTLAYRILQKSSLPEARDRVLTRSELHQIIDSTTRVSLPRTLVETLLEQSVVPQLGGNPTEIQSPSVRNPYWLIDASGVPVPKMLVARTQVEAEIQSAVKSAGVSFVFGTTGVGKSIVARTVACEFPGAVRWVDLRRASLQEVQIRLNQVLSLLAEIGSSTLMLEDLNSIEDPTVRTLLAQVIEAAHRHDMRVLISCYRRPSATALNGLGLDSRCVVECPHFNQEETNALVECAGGDLGIWGQIAHIAGGNGHPQLTHAFVIGMATKHWPKDAITQVISRGFTSPDLETARAAARANLINALPEPVRDLLYRLSIPIGFFKRSLAVEIGNVQPSIPRAGECFDKLVGQWIEVGTTDRYRLSPLARGFGREMLASEEQRQVHRMIAAHMLRESTIDASDIDSILVHGLAGDSQNSLWRLAHLVNTVDNETRETLGKHLIAFHLLDTSKPIYSKDLPTSVMLRMAQLRLIAESDEPEKIADVANALLCETDAVPDEFAGPYLKIAVLSAVLNRLSIANHIGGWIGLLSRFRRLVIANPDAAPSLTEKHPDTGSTTAALFNIGIARLDSVRKLETIFHDLTALEPNERRELLTPINAKFVDHQVIVQHPWVADSKAPGFDPTNAASRYERMARQAHAWGERTLSLQCSVAAAAILDELVGDAQAAEQALDGAQGLHGNDPILARAFAKLHHRNGQNTQALEFFRDTVPSIATANPIDAIYTVRDAAICAAQCGEWGIALSWFLRAQVAASPLQDIGLGAIGIGLGADAAVASLEKGDFPRALGLLKDALIALEGLDPRSNLQSAHCHRVVRHTILWVKTKVEGSDTKIQGRSISIYPGACSNPDPVREIQQHPLGHIDLAWYMLAELELRTGLDLGIRTILTERTAKGHIPISEHTLRIGVLWADVEKLDPGSFSGHLTEYAASAAYCIANAATLRDTFDPLNPQRALIPPLSRNGPVDSVAERSASHAILAYGARSLFDHQPEAIFQLREALTANLGQAYPGKSLLDNWNAAPPDLNDFDNEIAAILPRCLETGHAQPDLLFRAGLYLLDWIAQSPFKPVLMPGLAPWLRDQWQHVLEKQQFHLYNPRSNVPAIDSVLKSQFEGRRFAAKLALVADFAVRAPLSSSYRQHLSDLATDAGSD